MLDEFYGWLPWDIFLRLLDKFPLTVDVKGSSAVFNSKKIVITSNIPPNQWYDYQKNEHMIFNALMRRLDIVVNFVNKYQEDRGLSYIVEKGDWLPFVTSVDQSPEVVDLTQ